MEWVLDSLQAYPGPVAFVLLVACGLGLPPWSEEIVTIAMGHFVAEGHLTLTSALLWGYAGLLAGDSVVYWLGDHVGERVYSWPILGRHLGPRRRHRFNRFLLQHGGKAVFAARFVPGLRIIAYFVAGNLRMPYWKFFALDSIGAAIYAPAGVFLGYFFTDNLEQALHWIERFQIPIAVLGILGIVLIIRLWGRSRRRRLAGLRRLRSERQNPPPQEPPAAGSAPSGPSAASAEAPSAPLEKTPVG